MWEVLEALVPPKKHSGLAGVTKISESAVYIINFVCILVCNVISDVILLICGANVLPGFALLHAAQFLSQWLY